LFQITSQVYDIYVGTFSDKHLATGTQWNNRARLEDPHENNIPSNNLQKEMCWCRGATADSGMLPECVTKSH
jgi:hypothetical protein